MSFQFRRTESIRDALARIARKQIAAAINEVESPSLDRHRKVHQGRTHCKKVRALLRLVRPQSDRLYKSGNVRLRDAARWLAASRDAKVRLDTFESVINNNTIPAAELGDVREHLQQELDRISVREIDQSLSQFKQAMQILRAQFCEWELPRTGFKLIAGGLRLTHREAIISLHETLRQPESEKLHEFRKHAKYHWYQMRLLQPAWPDMLLPYTCQLGRLGELLGNEHNLAVLRVHLQHQCFHKPLDDLLTRRAADLRNQALPLAELLFAERSKAFANRIKAYWRLWRD